MVIVETSRPGASRRRPDRGQQTLLERLLVLWDYLHERGIDRERIARRAWLAPARCCLVNSDGAATVDLAFTTLRQLAGAVRERFGLPERESRGDRT